MTTNAHTPKLTKPQRVALLALSGGGKTLIGGISLEAAFDLEEMNLIEEYSDPCWPAFCSFRITEAGRAALSKAKAQAAEGEV